MFLVQNIKFKHKPKPFCATVLYVTISAKYFFFFFFYFQGEDGFPGIKGDFGVKGERVCLTYYKSSVDRSSSINM